MNTMMKAGVETGSLMNHLYSGAAMPAPGVGMGATILCWTDRHAGTIVKITPTQIHVQRDSAKRTDKNGMSEAQTYEYTADPSGLIEIFRNTKKGYRNTAGNGLLIGTRRAYHDYPF
jgi:hypothetical protein